MANPQPLSGKLALITGASKGIGAATAQLLASLGARVVINYSSDPIPASALVEKIGRSHALAIKADVSRVDEIERLVQETVAWGGQIDILIPNAGIALMRTVAQTTEDDFARTMDLNVKGPYFLCQVPTYLPTYLPTSPLPNPNSNPHRALHMHHPSNPPPAHRKHPPTSPPQPA
jgi:3-oxoacyl-[acyl-carrier protein] reductase